MDDCLFPTLVAQRAAFDDSTFARIYSRHRTPPGEALARYRTVLQVEVNRLADGGARTVLADIGAGSGLYLESLFAKLVRLDNYVAIEPSASMAAAIRDTLPRIQLNSRCVADAIPLDAPLVDVNLGWASDIAHLFESVEAFTNAVLATFPLIECLVIRNNTKETIGRVDWGRYFPALLEHDRSRQPALDDLLQGLVVAGFETVNSEIVDESFETTSDDYIAYYEARPFSGLRLLPPAAFEAGMKILRNETRATRHVTRVITRQLLVARRR